MVVFLLTQKAAFWAEFMPVPSQWPAEELSSEFTAHSLATGHPLHHAEVGNICLLRAASSTALSARKLLLCEQAYGREQPIKLFLRNNWLKATSMVDYIALLQPYCLPLIYCSHKQHQLLLHCYTWPGQINSVQFWQHLTVSQTKVPAHVLPNCVCCARRSPLGKLLMTNTTLAWCLISSSAIDDLLGKYTPSLPSIISTQLDKYKTKQPFTFPETAHIA